jgi:hypothetical protein
MVPDSAVAAAERTEAARQLIGQVQDTGIVELVTVSALELCVLGGPKHPLFEEPVARAWEQLGNRRRKNTIEWVTEGMVERGLLIENNPASSPGNGGGTYSLKPELGIALAARCRPAFIVVTQTAASNLRTPRFFALGDQNEPVRGIVAEEPVALPAEVAGDFPHVRKLGPLGRFYCYALFSRGKTAAALAAWAIDPPPQRPDVNPSAPRVVSLYRRSDGHDPAGIRLPVWGDGTKAHLERPGGGDQGVAEYDLEGLRAVMLDLISTAAS